MLYLPTSYASCSAFSSVTHTLSFG
jgi:hypothetical protein